MPVDVEDRVETHPTHLSIALGMTVDAITQTQMEIGSLVSDGYTNDEIADITHCSPATIKTHVRNIFRKIQAGRRHDFIYYFQPTRDYHVYPIPEVLDNLEELHKEFLDVLAEGYTDAEIAKICGWKKQEVSFLLQELRGITGINHRNEIIIWWIVVGQKNGLRADKPMSYGQAYKLYVKNRIARKKRVDKELE